MGSAPTDYMQTLSPAMCWNQWKNYYLIVFSTWGYRTHELGQIICIFTLINLVINYYFYNLLVMISWMKKTWIYQKKLIYSNKKMIIQSIWPSVQFAPELRTGCPVSCGYQKSYFNFLVLKIFIDRIFFNV